MELVLRMLFLALTNINIKFIELGKLTWRFYIATEALPITKLVELINKREFAKAALNKNSETFVIHIATLEVSTTILIYLSITSQV